METIDLAFRNLLYDLYSKDLSVKVKSSLAIRKERGQYAAGACPFGYQKDPMDRHKLLVEEEEAKIVRRIFTMSLQNMTSVQIAKTLNQEGVKTPIQFKIEKGMVKRMPKGKTFLWESSVIWQMLSNRSYVGDMVYGKTEKREVGRKNNRKPSEEWKIYPNHHEPIIEREQFEEIQQKKRKQNPKIKQRKHALAGKLLCGCCERSLYLRASIAPYFYCSSRYVNPQKDCIERIDEVFLEQFLLYQIKQRIQKQKKIEPIQEIDTIEQKRSWKEQQEKKKKIQSKIRVLQRKKIECYERYALQKERKQIAQEYQKEQYQISQQEEKLSTLLVQIEQNTKEIAQKQLLSEPLKLTEEVVQQWMKRVIIYDKEHIQIDWN